MLTPNSHALAPALSADPLVKLGSATTADVDDVAFRDFIRLHVARQNAAEATVASYMREARFFRRWLEGKQIALGDVTPRDMRIWIAELVGTGRKPTTIAVKLAGVRRLLDAAVGAGILLRNPATGLAAPRDRRLASAAARRTLSVEEVRRILWTLGNNDPIAQRDHAIAALLIGHGLRSVELSRLSLCDVDLVAKTIIVHGNVRDRVVYLRADVADRMRPVLETRLRDGAMVDAAFFVSLARNGAGNRGQRLSRRGIRFIVDRFYAGADLVPARRSRRGRRLRRAEPDAKLAARELGQRLPTTHGLRATNVTLAAAGGAEIQYVAADVGHADIRTTQRYFDLKRRRENNSALRIPVEF